MQALEDRDYFTDHAILKDPYAYFEAIRAKGRVYQIPSSDIVVVTGFEECIEVLRNTRDFSSAIALQGPNVPLPFQAQGPDITNQIQVHRDQILGHDLLVNYDDTEHQRSRSLLTRLFTPSRLRANEQFISEYSDQLVRQVVTLGDCELIKQVATPFVTMVIADLLGVPAHDRRLFMDAIDAGPPAGSLNSDDLMAQNQPLVIMGSYFLGYVQDRRQNPREDILSELANAKYPDGATPDVLEIVRLAMFLFGAGQDTSAKLLGNAMKYIVDEPDLQARLRNDPSLVAPLVEEVLRLEGSTKMTSRVARRDADIGGLSVRAGTRVMVSLSAANRDPGRWQDPGQLVLNRPKITEHLAFSRGAHVCIGAPLARTEVRFILQKFLEHTNHIDLAEETHGPRGHRNFDYEASFIIRGLSQMRLKLTPSAGFKAGSALQQAAKMTPSAVIHYSTAETKIAVLLADPAAKAVLDRHFPGVSANKGIAMAQGLTLRGIQQFAPQIFTSEALDAADEDFAALPVFL